MDDISSTLAGVRRRLVDLRTFQLSRLASCRGPLDLHRELAEEMRSDLESVRSRLETCKELGESLAEPDTRRDVRRQVDELEEELRNVRQAYRLALVSSKRQITASARSKRHELRRAEPSTRSAGSDAHTGARELSSSAGAGPSRSGEASRVEMGGDDALQTKTNEVTDVLRRTTQLMQTELERSVLSVQMLDESTRTLQLTQALYDTYTSLLVTSAQIVKTLEKADWTDRLLILGALALFLGVCAWIVKRRVLDRLVGGVLGVGGWWIRGSGRLVRLGLGGSGQARVAGSGGGVGESIKMGMGKEALRTGGEAGAAAAVQKAVQEATTVAAGLAGAAGSVAAAAYQAGSRSVGEDQGVSTMDIASTPVESVLPAGQVTQDSAAGHVSLAAADRPPDDRAPPDHVEL